MRTTPLLLLVIFSAMCLSMKCIKETEHCHFGIYLNNQTDRNVYAVVSFDYPDTSINFQNPFLGDKNYVAAGRRDIIYQTRGGECFEGLMSSLLKKDTLSIFLFDAAEVQADWLSVRQHYKVL